MFQLGVGCCGVELVCGITEFDGLISGFIKSICRVLVPAGCSCIVVGGVEILISVGVLIVADCGL